MMDRSVTAYGSSLTKSEFAAVRRFASQHFSEPSSTMASNYCLTAVMYVDVSGFGDRECQRLIARFLVPQAVQGAYQIPGTSSIKVECLEGEAERIREELCDKFTSFLFETRITMRSNGADAMFEFATSNDIKSLVDAATDDRYSRLEELAEIIVSQRQLAHPTKRDKRTMRLEVRSEQAAKHHRIMTPKRYLKTRRQFKQQKRLGIPQQPALTTSEAMLTVEGVILA